MGRIDNTSKYPVWARAAALGGVALVVGAGIVVGINSSGSGGSDENSIAVEGVSSSVNAAPGIYTAAGQNLGPGVSVPAAGSLPFVVQVAPGDSQVKCVLDGQYLGVKTEAPFTFGSPGDLAIGGHRIRCTLRSSTGTETILKFDFSAVSTSGSTTAGSGSTTAQTTASATTQTVVPTSSVTPPGTSGGGSTAGTSGSGPATAGSTEVVVRDAVGLRDALKAARPGTVIRLADGVFSGKDVRDVSGREPGRFVAATSGTADAPIVVRGSRAAVIDGGGTGGGYAIHLVGADHWRLEGFTVRSASKGIVLDRSNHTVIDGVRVTEIGDEGVHFRSFSSDNLLINSVVDTTGVDSPNYGEGVYIGSAKSNWATYTGGQPDASDRNQVIDNTITDTAAENIDIKEGSTGGVIRGNTFGGDKVASKNSADSWIDVKGNGYLIEANHGTTSARPGMPSCGDPKGGARPTLNPFCDGFQVHVQLDGWGRDNIFAGNRLEVNAPGVGIWLQNTAVDAGNVIRCDNVVSGAASGAYATNHYQQLDCAR